MSIRLEWISNKLFSIPNELTSYRLKVSWRFFQKIKEFLHQRILLTRRKKKRKMNARGPGWEDDDIILPIISWKSRKREESGWKRKAKECIAAINYADMMWLSWHAQQGIIKARWSDKGLSLLFLSVYSQSLVTAWHINDNDESLMIILESLYI